jgi:hypothetical protein
MVEAGMSSARKERDAMKQYLLSIYQPDGDPPPPEVLAKVMRDINALVADAKAAGVWVFNGGLSPPPSATVVRMQRGEVLMSDGPFAEAKEHIGGFMIVAVPDLDAALAWARRMAQALAIGEGDARSGLAIEVRAFQDKA